MKEKILETFKNVSKLLVMVFQLRVILLLAGLAAGLFGWRSHQDSKYWEGKAVSIDLKKDERAKFVLYNNRIIGKFRTVENGKEKEGTTSDYVPPEARGTTIVVPTDPSKPVVVNVKKVGFCFNPGLGSIYGLGKLQPVLDVKFFYMLRYGTSVGLATRGATIGGSRHLDDFSPKWMPLNNLEVYAGYEHPWRVSDLSKPRVFAGVRMNF